LSGRLNVVKFRGCFDMRASTQIISAGAASYCKGPHHALTEKPHSLSCASITAIAGWREHALPAKRELTREVHDHFESCCNLRVAP